jgi:hypothetical protein
VRGERLSDLSERLSDIGVIVQVDSKSSQRSIALRDVRVTNAVGKGKRVPGLLVEPENRSAESQVMKDPGSSLRGPCFPE